MDFGKAFTFVFDDPDWLKKIAINALIGLIPLVGQLYLLGWGLEIARRVAVEGKATPLPDIDFGTFLGYGFQAFVVGIVYSLPLLFVNLIAVAIYAAGGQVNQEGTRALALVGGICGGGMMIILSLLLGVLMPAAFTRTVVSGSIGDGLNIGAVWGLVRAAPSAYLLVLLGNIVAGFLASVVGTLACGIGLIFTVAYYQVVRGHFYGQAYAEARTRL